VERELTCVRQPVGVAYEPMVFPTLRVFPIEKKDSSVSTIIHRCPPPHHPPACPPNYGGGAESGAGVWIGAREVPTYLMGLPLGCNGENALMAPFAYDSRDFACILQTSGETQEKLKEHIASLPLKEGSPVRTANVSSASRIRSGIETDGGLMSLRVRGRRARNFKRV